MGFLLVFQHHGMLVFGAFIFALGYEVSGLGRRIALFLVKFMANAR